MKRLELNIQLFSASATITNARNGDYSIENNNEVQRITFTVKRTSGTTYWQDKKTLTFRLTYSNDDGTTTTLTQSVQFNFPSGSVGATKSASVDFTVPHKTDGTQNISYEASISTGTSVGTLHPTGSATLETIPRASTLTVNDANIGSATNIVINKASSNFTTTIQYKAFDENSWTTIVSKTSSQVYGWTVPTSFYSKIPSSKTMTCQFLAQTYNGDTLIGEKTTSATFTATGNPVINSFTLQDVNSTTTALTGDSSKMVRYVSNVRATVNTVGQNSATIYDNKVNGASTSGGIVTFNSASTNSYQLVVTDSRGYTTSQTKTMTMVDYVPLTINATIVRNQPTDGIVKISYNGNYFNGSFGSQNNTLTVQYRSREKNGTWSNWTNLSPTISSNTYSQSNYQISGYDYQKQYEFQIRAVDRIQSISVNGINVSKGQPVYWWDEDQFDVNVNANLKSVNSLYNKSEAGFQWDEYGNWKHRRNTSSDNWSIQNSSGTRKLIVYPETGDITCGAINNVDVTTSTWQTSGMNNSYTNYKKRSGWCIVIFGCWNDDTITSNELTLGTLPVGYRPNTRINFIFNGLGQDISRCYGYITTNGEIKLGISGGQSTSYFSGSVVFPIDG